MAETILENPYLRAREAAFEAEMFEEGRMPRLTIGVIAAELTRMYGADTSGDDYLTWAAQDVQAFSRLGTWSTQFAELVPKSWYRAELIGEDIGSAGVEGVVLSPTLIHAAVTYPDTRLLAELATWQPLSVEHATEVVRRIHTDGPIEGFQSGKAVSKAVFLHEQRRRGTPEEILTEAVRRGQDPNTKPLAFGDFKVMDPSNQPNYVVRGLARELGLDEDMAQRLVPQGVGMLQSRRRHQQEYPYDVNNAPGVANLIEAHASSRTSAHRSALAYSLIKRGEPGVKAILVAAVSQANPRSAHTIAGVTQLRHNPMFPSVVDRDFSDALRGLADNTVDSDTYGHDVIGEITRETARRRHTELMRTFHEDDTIDGELLHEALQRKLSCQQLMTAFSEVSELARDLFGIPEPERY